LVGTPNNWSSPSPRIKGVRVTRRPAASPKARNCTRRTPTSSGTTNTDAIQTSPSQSACHPAESCSRRAVCAVRKCRPQASFPSVIPKLLVKKMDRATQNNRANQCNSNNSTTGPGRPSGYQGSQSNSNNRANQKNPNNPQYSSKSNNKK
ncbi:hypothetical protein FOCC_FOCC003643, partial [Frankliniella occidentalis]